MLGLTLWSNSSGQTGCTRQPRTSNRAQEREGIDLPHCGRRLLGNIKTLSDRQALKNREWSWKERETIRKARQSGAGQLQWLVPVASGTSAGGLKQASLSQKDGHVLSVELRIVHIKAPCTPPSSNIEALVSPSWRCEQRSTAIPTRTLPWRHPLRAMLPSKRWAG